MNAAQPPRGGDGGGEMATGQPQDSRGRVMFNKAHCVWMGDVEPFMTEEYIREQFTQLGLNVINVRIMHSNKFQEQNLTYAFVELDDERTAIRTVQRFNDKPFPTDPRRKFRLNFTCQTQIKQAQDENGLFVGELSPDVDDLALYSSFQAKFPSVKWAKVIKDQTGMSKGFGFVKFSSDEEYQRALTEMNGFQGLGTNALRVSQATPKDRKNRDQQGGGGGGGWGGGHGGYQNPMVAQHQQHMHYFNQATAGYQSPADYYAGYGGAYGPAAAAYAGSAYGGAYGGQPPMAGGYQHQQQYYEQQMRQQQRLQHDARGGGGGPAGAAVGAPDPATLLEDHGNSAYDALQQRLISADLRGDIEAARYSEVPLIVK